MSFKFETPSLGINPQEVKLYACDPRDGAQDPKSPIDTVERKLLLVQTLADSRIPFSHFELGYAGSGSGMDSEIWREAQQNLRTDVWERCTAFASSRMNKSASAEDDPFMRALVEAGTRAATIFVKSDTLQVAEVLKVSNERNLELIRESVAFLAQQGKEVIVDLEHFFQGYMHNAQYARQCIMAAIDKGATTIVGCDTNGLASPAFVKAVVEHLFNPENTDGLASHMKSVKFGLHLHNDGSAATRSLLEGLQTGHVKHLQGNLVAAGERTGNDSFVDLFGAAYNECGADFLPPEAWQRLRSVSQRVSKLLTGSWIDDKTPFVGGDAFTHSAGMHTKSLSRSGESYDPCPFHGGPSLRSKMNVPFRYALGPQSGTENIGHYLAPEAFGIEHDCNGQVGECLNLVKNPDGINYTQAWGSAGLAFYRHMKDPESLFEVVSQEGHYEISLLTGGTVKSQADAGVIVQLPDQTTVEAAEHHPHGMVNGLANSLREALKTTYPCLEHLELVDYESKSLEGGTGANVVTYITLRSRNTGDLWATAVTGENVIQTAFEAISEGFKYWIHAHRGDFSHYQDTNLLEKYRPRGDLT
ncbi:MAG TPA: alpha-isopropylmalate synthase regulatory domain-containing protein [Candidatus Gracilibacteria bacterium]